MSLDALFQAMLLDMLDGWEPIATAPPRAGLVLGWDERSKVLHLMWRMDGEWVFGVDMDGRRRIFAPTYWRHCQPPSLRFDGVYPAVPALKSQEQNNAE